MSFVIILVCILSYSAPGPPAEEIMEETRQPNSSGCKTQNGCLRKGLRFFFFYKHKKNHQQNSKNNKNLIPFSMKGVFGLMKVSEAVDTHQ